MLGTFNIGEASESTKLAETSKATKGSKAATTVYTSYLPDNIAAPVVTGLVVGVGFIVLSSLFVGSSVMPLQADYDNLEGFVVEYIPGPYQPWLAPSYGIPHLWITEVATTDPGIPNKARYEDEVWLHRAMDFRGNLAEIDYSIDIGQEIRIGTVIRLDDAEKEAFFDFYKQARTDTSLFQVMFPHDRIKYYQINFLEVA